MTLGELVEALAELKSLQRDFESHMNAYYDLPIKRNGYSEKELEVRDKWESRRNALENAITALKSLELGAQSDG